MRHLSRNDRYCERSSSTPRCVAVANSWTLVLMVGQGNTDRTHVAAAAEVPKIKAKHAHEALAPAAVPRHATTECSPKRTKRVPAAPGQLLSPKKVGIGALSAQRGATRPAISVTKVSPQQRERCLVC